ncbi:hypothetical protein S7711_05378 [Stachybotrys chartarum IBT 7711]|uniref:Uncharacterized protein n=1 Tax=Stachybotrys chartarum (strain CBS 109288 / IBT 7711) TaxID=1280523 RepID=A0A084B9A0_STACB|nr:hypothetical protein S7711_05378 [Stachybotrys chartarum IBT 7711]
MDAARDFSQMSQESPRMPASPNLDDEDLFYKVFDWERYCESTQPLDQSSSYPGQHSPPPSPQDLPQLIRDIPRVIRNLTIQTNLQPELLAMRPSYRPDDEAATVSDYSGQTPPELVQGGSTSPSDHSGSALEHVEETRDSPDVTLREFQAQDDEWTYPQTHPAKAAPRRYPPSLQVSDESAEHASGLKRRGSESIHDKRRRHVVDPVQTANVRKTGACLPCRMTKTGCQENGVCPTCRKTFPNHSHMSCTRYTPGMTWPVISKVPDVWSSTGAEEERLRSGPQFYHGKQRDIFIFFSRDPASSPLLATVQAYRSQNGPEEGGHSRMANFPKEKMPTHESLWKWVETQIRSEPVNDFRTSIQNFLMEYSDPESYSLPKHGFVTKVHRMSCFFRIWKTSSFWCRDPSNNIVGLPLSVQAHLRKIALKGLHYLEGDVLKELDEILTQQVSPKSDGRIAVWASMWQLILMYRDLIVAFRSFLDRAEADSNTGPEKLLYKRLSEGFFPLLTIFYHYQFRTKKSLEVSLDGLKSPYPGMTYPTQTISRLAQSLLDTRKAMYQSFQASRHEIDQLLCVFVVNHELKKLNARQRVSKPSQKSKNSKGAAGGDCEVDDE